MGIKDALKKLEESVKEIPLLPKESKMLREENERLKKLFAKYSKRVRKKANGGEIKIKKKPLSPRQKALVDSANRIRKLEAAEERTKGITPKVKPKKPIVPKKKPKLANGGLVSGKAQAKKYFTGVF
tara:strand:- start:208 stop:588 length:381 start_codon:yes stop_codon:yes gene_type:complete